MSESEATPQVPRLTYLRIRNYRALRDVELRDLTPLTVLVGPNGSGKSTVLDALAFLAEAASGNLQQAWEKRNRFAGMRTRGSEGAIEFEVEVTWANNELLVYILDIDEAEGKLILKQEQLCIKTPDQTYHPIAVAEGVDGRAGLIDVTIFRHRVWENLEKYDRAFEGPTSVVEQRLFWTTGYSFMPVVRALKISSDKEVTALAELLTSYRYIHLTDNHTKGVVDAGPRERLSPSGDNLPNVLYYLQQKHPAVLQDIIQELRRQVPALAEVLTEVTSDERLLLRFRDEPFEKPLPAQYMSEGTLRLTALLTLLREPEAAGLLGLEEPESELYPRLLPRLAEELNQAAETRQLLVTTHATALLTPLEPKQVWILNRGADGYTQAICVADLPEVVAMVEEGLPLGYLWARNFFDVGDPLSGLPTASARE